jgi:hypothetical protein
VRAIVSAVRGEVHQRKREVARHVDPAQRVVEFDAVEHQDAVAPAHDVVEMQIAVACAHEALRVPLGEQRCDARQFRFVPRVQRGFARHRDVERIEQRPALRGHARRAAEVAARGAARRVQMMAGQRGGERIGIREAGVVRRAANRQHRVRVEPAHAYEVLAGRWLPLPARAGLQRLAESAAAAARDERPDAEVQRTGERAIERVFRERATAPLRGAHEIDEREAHRLDAFVRVASGQIDDGQMRFDPLDAACGVRIGCRAAQCAIELDRLASCVGAASENDT